MPLETEERNVLIYSFISRLQNMRQMGDYDDLFDWAEEDVLPKIPQVEKLVCKLKKMTVKKTLL